MEPPPARALARRLLGERCASVVHVGARGGLGTAWYRLGDLTRAYGFDADAAECARLAAAADGVRYVPRALGRRPGPATLHLTCDPACASLYPPDPALAARYPELAVMTPIGTAEVEVTTLDDWCRAEGVGDVAFLMLDTQGSELDVLAGATETLAGCLGVEAEVELSPLYLGQPLFADLDAFLRQQGFTLWRLGSLVHYSERPSPVRPRRETLWFDSVPVEVPAAAGRASWGHALYFRDYPALPGRPSARRDHLLLAALLEAAGDPDAAAATLAQLATAGDGRLATGEADLVAAVAHHLRVVVDAG